MTHEHEKKTESTRIPTDDLPGIGTSPRRRWWDPELRVSVSVMIGFVMMAIGLATFASNHVFATKQDLIEQKVDRVRNETAVLRDLANLADSVKDLTKDFATHSAEEKLRYDRLDRNLRKFMTKRGVQPEGD